VRPCEHIGCGFHHGRWFVFGMLFYFHGHANIGLNHSGFNQIRKYFV
jgi:hypothetical protein